MLTPARAATSPRRSPGTRRLPDVGQAGLLRGDLGPAGDEELADLGAVVHALDATTPGRGAGVPCRYTFRQRLPSAGRSGFAEGRGRLLVTTPSSPGRAVVDLSSREESEDACCRDVRPR